jgi:hypothetical protein
VVTRDVTTGQLATSGLAPEWTRTFGIVLEVPLTSSQSLTSRRS